MRSVIPMKAAKTGYIIISAIFVVIGAVMTALPEMLTKEAGMCNLIGIAMTAFGVIKLVGYFSKDPFRLAFQYDLASGILMIALGIAALSHPDTFIEVIGAILGVYILSDGLFKVQIAIDARIFGIEKWWSIAAAAVLPIITGFVLIINPDAKVTVISALLGASFIFEGAMNLITVIIAVRIVQARYPPFTSDSDGID